MDYDTLIRRFIDSHDGWMKYPNPVEAATNCLWRNVCDHLVGECDYYTDDCDAIYSRDEFDFLIQELVKRYDED